MSTAQSSTPSQKSADREKILQTMGELLEVDVALTGKETLADFDKWDSLAVISFISYADEEFDKVLSGTAILEAKTVDDIVSLLD